MKFDPRDVATQCKALGPQVEPLPAGIDGARLLWAISGNESSFGTNSVPHHEPAYDIGGVYAKSSDQAVLLAQFGSSGACSYGPMQVMLVNCPPPQNPDDFSNLGAGMNAGLFALNNLLRRFNPQTLGDIGSCYNAGHIQTSYSPAVQQYILRLQKNYNVPLLEA